MEPVYGALVEQLQGLPGRERQDLLARWSSFNLDEYVGLGPDDPESFAASMERCLGAPLGLAPGQLRPYDSLASLAPLLQPRLCLGPIPPRPLALSCGTTP